MQQVIRLRRRAPLRIRAQDDAAERSIVSPIERRKRSVRIAQWMIFALLLLGTIGTIGPLLWMVSGALKPSIDIFRTPPVIWPSAPEWENFVKTWQQLNSLLYLANTVELAAGAVALQLLVSATAAYALSKLKPIFSNVLLFFFLSTLMVPALAYLIPQYFTVIHLPILGISLVNSWWAIWLPEAANAFNIIILKSFFDTLPNELIEAAKIDGANAWQIFTRIVLPNSLPALTVISMFTIFATWKDFLWPLLVINDPNSQPISVALYQQAIAQNSYQPQNVLLAGFVIATVPPILLFLIFQRQIMRGVVTTGLKG
jgi:multiple sugar transport system permease protein